MVHAVGPKTDLSVAQRQALSDLARCRTVSLGGHAFHCHDFEQWFAFLVEPKIEPTSGNSLQIVAWSEFVKPGHLLQYIVESPRCLADG